MFTHLGKPVQQSMLACKNSGKKKTHGNILQRTVSFWNTSLTIDNGLYKILDKKNMAMLKLQWIASWNTSSTIDSGLYKFCKKRIW